MALSVLTVAAMSFSAAFVEPLTVENRTRQPLLITPVGTLYGREHKAPLPMVMLAMLPVLSPRAGPFPLGPDESVTLHYNADDITVSELVIEDERGHTRQLAVNPEQNKEHGPLAERYVLEDIESLPEASPAVLAASVAARGMKAQGIVLLVLLIAPWLAYWALRRRVVERKSDPPGPLPK
ncbi:hypothetical protein [Cystobacter fuscus]|uniref:hypothetical protein n=1 Tax=Cystobacter fuscus TaxID=43 RepID=UPI002B2F668C|nr:hypothetical protein F0U63_26525 [Cystobacter fuscus]